MNLVLGPAPVLRRAQAVGAEARRWGIPELSAHSNKCLQTRIIVPTLDLSVCLDGVVHRCVGQMMTSIRELVSPLKIVDENGEVASTIFRENTRNRQHNVIATAAGGAR